MMNEDLKESISKMIVNGKRLELPIADKFTNYPAVKKALQVAGGKYSKCGFSFPEDAKAIKDRLLGGELVNDKKKFQFFPTPSHVVDLLIAKAMTTKGMSILEPSAGQGAIVDKAIKEGGKVDMFELMPENTRVLNRKYALDLMPTDFLTVNPDNSSKYDRVIANPPFSKNQDIDHVLHMYKFLKDGGVLVSVMSKSWVSGSQKKQVSFRQWLDSVGAKITEIEAGEFKSSGTNIATVIVEVTKK